MESAAAPPLTSIVILAFNEYEYTRQCVESIERCTPEPFELVFVDNGSTDATREYLATLDATVILNDRNMGFGGGCNQGIAASKGERILLLNNDTVVTDGWLAALHAGLDADPQRGITGPRSNRVADVQRVQNCAYDEDSLVGLDSFAASWSARHRGQGTQLLRLIGFCMLIRREVVDQVGGFDVRFGLGNFEDDDICLRAGVAGWKCWVCDDSFVHHFGSRTFAGAGIDHTASMAANWQRFSAKWGLTLNGTNSYDPAQAVMHRVYSFERDYAPLVAAPSDDAVVEIDARGMALLFPAHAVFPEETAMALQRVVRSLAGKDAVTLVVRVAPGDAASIAALEDAADLVGDEQLCDIVLVERSDANDAAVMSACDAVIAYGTPHHAIMGLARRLGTRVVHVDMLETDAVVRASPAA